MKPHKVDYEYLKTFESISRLASCISSTSNKALDVVTRGSDVRYQVWNRGELELDTESLLEAVTYYNQLP